MQFVAYEMAAILQNVAKQRTSEGRLITLKDLRNASRLGWLSYFPGMTQYGTGSGGNPEYYMPLGYMPCVFIYHVVGTGTNTAVCKWSYIIWPGNPTIYGAEGANGTVIRGVTSGTTINYTSSSQSASSIYPSLKISSGETKIIVECTLQYFSGRYFSSGTPNNRVSLKNAFNFLLFHPKPANAESVFSAVTIFTSQGGFTDSPPQ